MPHPSRAELSARQGGAVISLAATHLQQKKKLVRAETGWTLNPLRYALLFGILWGVGGITFGLAIRYLGIALGYAIALGLCAAFGRALGQAGRRRFADDFTVQGFRRRLWPCLERLVS